MYKDIDIMVEDWNEQGRWGVSNAARTCYDTFDKASADNDEKLIRSTLIAQGHLSMLRFAVATIRIKGCSRVFTHEIVRHQAGVDFAQRSQRYVLVTKPEYVHPDEIRSGFDSWIYTASMKLSWLAYRILVWRMGKTKKQIARYVLPNACASEIVIIANVQAWRHMVQERTAIVCQPEMRHIMLRVYSLLDGVFPSLFADLHINERGEVVVKDHR